MVMILLSEILTFLFQRRTDIVISHKPDLSECRLSFSTRHRHKRNSCWTQLTKETFSKTLFYGNIVYICIQMHKPDETPPALPHCYYSDHPILNCPDHRRIEPNANSHRPYGLYGGFGLGGQLQPARRASSTPPSQSSQRTGPSTKGSYGWILTMR